MYNLGSIVLVPFPFSDLSSNKVRPALVVSKDNPQEQNLIVCFITSNLREHKKAVKIESSSLTGLKMSSVVRLDKVATLDQKIVVAKLGKVDDSFFKKNSQKFFDIFGFEL